MMNDKEIEEAKKQTILFVKDIKSLTNKLNTVSNNRDKMHKKVSKLLSEVEVSSKEDQFRSFENLAEAYKNGVLKLEKDSKLIIDKISSLREKILEQEKILISKMGRQKLQEFYAKIL